LVIALNLQSYSTTVNYSITVYSRLRSGRPASRGSIRVFVSPKPRDRPSNPTQPARRGMATIFYGACPNCL